MVLLRNPFPHRSEIVLVPNKRESYKVHAFLEPDLEVCTILFRKRGNPQIGLWQVDPLARGHGSADHNSAAKAVFLNLTHLEFGEAICEEDRLTGADVLEEMWIADREDPGLDLSIDTEIDRRSHLEVNAFLGELAEPDLGPTKVLENADLAAERFRHLTDTADLPSVVLPVSVGEVQTDHIHPGLE